MILPDLRTKSTREYLAGLQEIIDRQKEGYVLDYPTKSDEERVHAFLFSSKLTSEKNPMLVNGPFDTPFYARHREEQTPYDMYVLVTFGLPQEYCPYVLIKQPCYTFDFFDAEAWDYKLGAAIHYLKKPTCPKLIPSF